MLGGQAQARGDGWSDRSGGEEAEAGSKGVFLVDLSQGPRSHKSSCMLISPGGRGNGCLAFIPTPNGQIFPEFSQYVPSWTTEVLQGSRSRGDSATQWLKAPPGPFPKVREVTAPSGGGGG